MKHTRIITIRSIIIQLIFLSSFGFFNLHAQNNFVNWSSFNSGFVESKTSNTMVKSVAGQNFVGTSMQVNTQIISGFLADTLFRTILVAVKEQEGLPTEYSLAQNYPNPFNPSTTIKYQLPIESKVTLTVYNVLGQVVKVLADEIQTAGYKSVVWDGGGNTSSVYFYRIVAGDFTQTKKFILIK